MLKLACGDSTLKGPYTRGLRDLLGIQGPRPQVGPVVSWFVH